MDDHLDRKSQLTGNEDVPPDRRSRVATAAIVCSICVAITSVALALAITSYSHYSGMERKLREMEAFRSNENKAIGELEGNIQEINTNQEYNKKQLDRFQADAKELEKELLEFERLVHELREKLQDRTKPLELKWRDSDKKLHDMDANLELTKKRTEKIASEADSLKKRMADLELIVRDLKEKIRENKNKSKLALKDSNTQTAGLVTRLFGLLETDEQRRGFCKTFVGIRNPSVKELGYCGV